MLEAVGGGSGGHSDIEHGDGALHFVMAGLVEQVTQRGCAHGLACEVCGQTREGASENANHGIELSSATLQVGVGDGQVGAVGGDDSGEQRFVFPVPEIVLALYRCCCGRHDHGRNGSGVRRGCIGKRALAKRGRRSEDGQQSDHGKQAIWEPIVGHRCCRNGEHIDKGQSGSHRARVGVAANYSKDGG